MNKHSISVSEKHYLSQQQQLVLFTFPRFVLYVELFIENIVKNISAEYRMNMWNISHQSVWTGSSLLRPGFAHNGNC